VNEPATAYAQARRRETGMRFLGLMGANPRSTAMPTQGHRAT